MENVDIVCAGILVADLFAPPLPHLPAAGELLAVDSFLLTVGGCAANAALDLTRLGCRSAVSGMVGSDAAGDFVVDALAQGGVHTGGILRTEDAPTSRTVILPVLGEDRRYIHAFGANGRFTAGEIDRAMLDGARVLYVGGYLLMPAFTSAGLAELFGDARSRGMLTVLDVAGVPQEGGLSGVEDVLPYTDLFLPNRDEAALLTGESDPERQAELLFQCGAMTVCITMGGDGALLHGRDARLFCPAWPVDVVDSSGGGDAFAAGMIAAHLAGMELRKALAFASVIGASACTALGCTAGVLARPEAEARAALHTARVVAR